MNRNLFDHILDFALIGVLAWWLLLWFKFLSKSEIYKRFEMLFTKKDKLPYDYEVVHKLLDGLIKQVAEKYDIEIKFKIHKALIQLSLCECEVLVNLKNNKHELSFYCFKNIETPYKKTPLHSLQNVCMTLVSSLENNIVDKMILDNLITLNKKLSGKPDER